MAEILYGDKTWKQILNETLSSIVHLCGTKGAEYAASDKDQLANFRRRADRFELPMEAAWAIYAGKHWDAIETYITDLIHKHERLRSEPLEGRVDDLIVYLILFKAMLAERGQTKLNYCIDCDKEQPPSGCSEPGCRRAQLAKSKLELQGIKPLCNICGEPFVAACDNDKCPHHQAGF